MPEGEIEGVTEGVGEEVGVNQAVSLWVRLGSGGTMGSWPVRRVVVPEFRFRFEIWDDERVRGGVGILFYLLLFWEPPVSLGEIWVGGWHLGC